MAAVGARENRAEVSLRRELWRRGLRYRLYSGKLIGRPDMVFVASRVVVFVDGDFWHGRQIRENGDNAFRATMRTERREWWVSKLKRNIERDAQVTEALVDDGWRVMRYWESEIAANLQGVANRVERVVRTRMIRLSR